MTFLTWNVRGLCRTGSLNAVARELGKYRSKSLGVQEDRVE
jgi:hypothetical protein